MSATLLHLPARDIKDVPQCLRNLAKAIEDGEYGDAHNVAFVVDCGDGRVDCGLMGPSAEPGAVAHLLFAIAQRRLEQCRE